MARHPNNVVNAMRLIGYSLADMLPAYPEKDEGYLDQLLRDSALALNRPVIPYGLLGIHPCRSRYFNVNEHGFRSNGGPQPWPPDRGKVSIFFFGGSTAVGFNVEDGQTIPAQLQCCLESGGAPCEVYNFGSGNYTSRHDTLRFLDLLDRGFVPDYAIFLDGYNDGQYALGNRELVNLLDSLYQREKRRRRSPFLKSLIEFLSGYGRQAQLTSAESYTPEIAEKEAEAYLSESGIRNALQSSHRPLSPSKITAFHTRLSKLVWERYLDSAAMIRVLAASRGVKTLFVWQPVPFFRTTGEQRIMERLYFVYRYGVMCSLVYEWLDANQFPSMEDSDEFFNLSSAGESLGGVLYLDVCHYTAAFCAVIAEAISKKFLSLYSPPNRVLPA